MTRLQINLIDMRTGPDKISQIIYNWILNYIDQFSKFSWTFRLKTKADNDVCNEITGNVFCFWTTSIVAQ